MAPQRSSSSRDARLAVGLAAAAAASIVTAFGVFGVVWAANGRPDGVEALVGVGHLGGVLLSVVAFGLAARARFTRPRRAGHGSELPPLWFPLGLLPTMVVVWLLALAQAL
jgi:hypothetical protein